MKARILYIEDNDQNFYLVHFMMQARGHQVTRAKDGREGIEASVTGKPDLILLDIQLPVMDGYEVARVLRSIPSLQSTPIVALTSYAMPGDREKSMEAGCTVYVEKPLDPYTFAGQIEQLLKTRPEPEEPGPES